MTSAREDILARIRAATSDTHRASTPTEAEEASLVDWEYHRPRQLAVDILDHFDERVTDYKATVIRVSAAELPARIGTTLTDFGAHRVVIPQGADQAWVTAAEDHNIEVHRDAPAMSATELDSFDAVVTGAAVGIAETGTIVMDHSLGQGRRAISLVPDLHVCVVRAEQVVTDVPEAVGRLTDSARAGNPMTWISGPSATSDIELNRVEGVHGPRTLVVLLVH